MCALQPPFNAQSLHQLAQKIIQGKYADVPTHFSQNVKNLLSAMLNRDPSKRPNINSILKMPCIADRIKLLLNEDDFKDEFSHTILHNKNVFDEFRAIQAKKKSDEEKKQQEEKLEAEAAQKKKELESQMSAMKLKEYKPKYGQDQQLFNEMYMDYVNRLQKEGYDTDNTDLSSPATHSDRPYSQQSSNASVYQDKDDETDTDSQPGDNLQKRQISTGEQQMINISACEFAEFQKYMIGQYGEQ